MRSCYYQLRQLRVVMRSLSHDGAVVLVHAFVTSRIDHSCSVLVGLPWGLIGRLDRVLRCAARLIGHIPKYASVSAYMRDVLHWLPVSKRILYRISALVKANGAHHDNRLALDELLDIPGLVYCPSIEGFLFTNRTASRRIEHATPSLSWRERCSTLFLQHRRPNSLVLNPVDYIRENLPIQNC